MKGTPALGSFLLLGGVLVGCATAPTPGPSGYLESDWILGSWRLDGYLRAGTQTQEYQLLLTFLPDGFVEVLDERETSSLTQRCPWYPRMNRVETSCGGINLFIRNSTDGPLEVEMRGTVPVPYYQEVCVKYGRDSQGRQVCLHYRSEERFRRVSTRGETTLEPHG